MKSIESAYVDVALKKTFFELYFTFALNESTGYMLKAYRSKQEVVLKKTGRASTQVIHN